MFGETEIPLIKADDRYHNTTYILAAVAQFRKEFNY
jgi:hypothetical protein